MARFVVGGDARRTAAFGSNASGEGTLAAERNSLTGPPETQSPALQCSPKPPLHRPGPRVAQPHPLSVILAPPLRHTRAPLISSYPRLPRVSRCDQHQPTAAPAPPSAAPALLPPHPHPFRRSCAGRNPRDHPSPLPTPITRRAATHPLQPPTHTSLAKSPHTRSNTAHEFPTDAPAPTPTHPPHTPTPRNRRHHPSNRPDLPADPEIPADQNRSGSITIDHNRSQSITIDHNRSQSITIDHNRSQSITVEQDRTPSNTTHPSRPDMDPPQTPRNVENLRLPDQPRRRSAQTSTGNAIAGSSMLTETASAADQARAWRRRASNSGPESSATRTN